MKKNFILALLSIVSIGVIAQIQPVKTKSFTEPITMSTSYSVSRGGAPASIASVDTIWMDDFSDTANWAYVGDSNQWNIDTVLTANLLSQGFENSLNSVSGGNFALIDSDQSGATGSQDAVIEYVGGIIDCSANPDVRLVFQTYLRQYNEKRQVLVSNDGGTVWDTIDVLTQFGTSVTSPNGYTEIVNISAVAGGQSNVKLKFRYLGSFDWFWSIDDVRIVSAPKNELQLTQEFYNGSTDASYATYYTMMPLKQADSAMINFGALVKNDGVVDQTNTHVSLSVSYNGMEVYTDTTDSLLTVPNSFTGFDFQNSYLPSNGVGMYDIELEVASDSVDEVPRNNTISRQFEVAGSQYRRDNDVVTNENWFDASSSWEMLLRYEIFVEDTVVAVSTYFPYNFSTQRGVTAGDSISYYVYSATDLVNPVTYNDGYIVQSADVNGWITLPMPAQTLAPGMYYAGFKLYNNTSSVGTNSDINASTAPYTCLIRRNMADSTDPWGYTTNYTPFIRMYTKNDSACTGVNIDIAATVYDTTTFGSIDIAISGSGAQPYTYSWAGPDSFSANTQNISNLANRGMYYVTVTDVFGCEGVDSALVAGTVTVNELKIEKNISIYPNPNNGNFQLQGSVSESGYYSIVVTNLVGQTVSKRRVYIANEINQSLSVDNVRSGVYVLTISDEKGNYKSLKFILE